jgi:hypothetical protein
MHQLRFTTGLASVVAVGAMLTGCQASHLATVPVAMPNEAGAARGRLSDKIPDCRASRAAIPGRYILIYSDGNVTENAYWSFDAFWAEGTVEGGATGQNGNSPPTPTQRTYLYTGTYQLAKTKQTGCVYLETTVNGKPFASSSNNASLAALPNFRSKKFAFDGGKGGPVKIGRLKIGATGGNATLTLILKGRQYDTGTLSLTERTIRNAP